MKTLGNRNSILWILSLQLYFVLTLNCLQTLGNLQELLCGTCTTCFCNCITYYLLIFLSRKARGRNHLLVLQSYLHYFISKRIDCQKIYSSFWQSSPMVHLPFTGTFAPFMVVSRTTGRGIGTRRNLELVWLNFQLALARQIRITKRNFFPCNQ